MVDYYPNNDFFAWHRLKNIDSESNSVTCIMTGDKFPHDHVVDGTDQIVTFGICW